MRKRSSVYINLNINVHILLVSPLNEPLCWRSISLKRRAIPRESAGLRGVRDGRLGLNLGQIGIKFNKLIRVISLKSVFSSEKKVLKSDLKKYGNFFKKQFWRQNAQTNSQISHFWY